MNKEWRIYKGHLDLIDWIKGTAHCRLCDRKIEKGKLCMDCRQAIKEEAEKYFKGGQ